MPGQLRQPPQQRQAAPAVRPGPRPSEGQSAEFTRELVREQGQAAPASGGVQAPAPGVPAAGGAQGAAPAAGGAAAAQDCAVPAPAGDYVTMDSTQKAGYLAGLFRMPDVAGTFAARGFNQTDQARLAAVMQNEGGTNERRRMLGDHYASAARSLTRKLQSAGRALDALSGAEADPKLRLTEDERAVLAAAQQGRFDLAALSGGAGEARDTARAGLQQAGIDHQVALYDEYQGLDARNRGGERLSREDRARLSTLEGRSLYSSGDFADARGVSSARFRGIYDEGQTRFEPDRFRRSRDRVESWLRGGEKGRGGSVGAGGEDASAWVARHPEARQGNMDALADAETSWGTTQIMGHYADRGDLHKADGSTFDMNDMRAAAARRSPNGTDVDMQISYFRDIAGVQGHLGSPEDIAVQYNGPSAPPSYAAGIRAGAVRYDRARGALPELDCDLPAPGRQSALDVPGQRLA